MHRLIMLLVAVGLIVFVSVGADADVCDSLLFEVSAELTNDPGFEGLYKYTVSGYWEVSGVEQGWGLSYILFSLGNECPCLCDSTSGGVYFPEPAGTSEGIDNDTEEPCEAAYLGLVECNGLEDITTDVVIKFEVPDNQSCEPIHQGTGTWIFYSTMLPLPEGDYIDTIIIKYGEMLCDGVHFCEPPNCYENAPVSTENSSWGSIKLIVR